MESEGNATHGVQVGSADKSTSVTKRNTLKAADHVDTRQFEASRKEAVFENASAGRYARVKRLQGFLSNQVN